MTRPVSPFRTPWAWLTRNLICPVCRARGVPFWPVFWGFWPTKTVPCNACGTHLRQNTWLVALVYSLAFVPLFFVLAPIMILTLNNPLIGGPLLVGVCFGGMWLTAVGFRLHPVKDSSRPATERKE